MTDGMQINDKEWTDYMNKAQKELSIKAQDGIVQKTAQMVRRDLVKDTPKKTGLTRMAWSVVKVGLFGERIVINSSPVMRFLEYGTPKKNPGAKIYPKKAKALAIPLTRTSLPGKKGTGYGKFAFRKWVRGIKPMKIVENYVPKAAETLFKNVMEVLDKI